jgi:hypothetical protein
VIRVDVALWVDAKMARGADEAGMLAGAVVMERAWQMVGAEQHPLGKRRHRHLHPAFEVGSVLSGGGKHCRDGLDMTRLTAVRG